MPTGLPATQEVLIMMQTPSNTVKDIPFLRPIGAKKNELMLPVDTGGRRKHNEEVLATVDIKVLGVVADNHLLQPVTLPIGWKRVTGNLTGYSYIIDNKNRKRVEILLHQPETGAQRVYMYLCHRYGRSFDHNRFCNTGECVTRVTDGDRVIYTTRPVVARKHDGIMYVTMEESDAAASAWLDSHYPKWHQPEAYWD